MTSTHTPTRLTRDEVRQLMERRRSGAAGLHRKRTPRGERNRRAVQDSRDN